jgi:hypothetical protein
MIGLGVVVGMWVANAWALVPADHVTLDLAGGTTIDGQFVRPASETSFNVLVDDKIVTVELALVETVKVNGVDQELAPFRAEVAERWAASRNVDLGPTPLPAVALGSSILFAGTGQALLKQGPEFRGYAALEVVCLGLETVAILYAEDAGLLVAVGAIHVGIKGLSGMSAYHEARRRRARARDR